MSQAKSGHFHKGQKNYKTLAKFETLFMCASTYMTLSQKIEKIEIHSLVGKISGKGAGGSKKIIYKNKKNLSTCRHWTDFRTLIQNILYHSYTLCESTI